MNQSCKHRFHRFEDEDIIEWSFITFWRVPKVISCKFICDKCGETKNTTVKRDTDFYINI